MGTHFTLGCCGYGKQPSLTPEDRKRRAATQVRKTWCAQLWLRIGTGVVSLFRVRSGLQVNETAGIADIHSLER